jgi:hypothetical protein
MGVTLNTLKDAAAKLHGHTLDPVLDGDVTVDRPQTPVPGRAGRDHYRGRLLGLLVTTRLMPWWL